MNDTAKMGAFARATAELGTKRPLRDPHLRRIVSDMRDGNAHAAGKACWIISPRIRTTPTRCS